MSSSSKPATANENHIAQENLVQIVVCECSPKGNQPLVERICEKNEFAVKDGWGDSGSAALTCEMRWEKSEEDSLIRTYVIETDIYSHLPILCPHAAQFHERRISSMTFTSAHLYSNVYMWVGVARALSDSSDFGLLGSKVYKNGRLPALDADEPLCKIWRH